MSISRHNPGPVLAFLATLVGKYSQVGTKNGTDQLEVGCFTKLCTKNPNKILFCVLIWAYKGSSPIAIKVTLTK